MSGSALCLPGSEDPGGLQSPEVREDFKCLRSGEEGGLGGQKAPRSEGQSPPSGIRGDPDLRDSDLKGYLRQLLQQPCSYHLHMPGRGQGWGLAVHQGPSSPPVPHCCLLAPQPPRGLSFSASASSLLQCRAPACPSPPTSYLPPQLAWLCALDPALLTSFLTC